MPYTPYNRPQSEFRGGKQILASEDFRYTPEGGTIDAAKVGARYVEVGEPFVRDMATGKYVPFTDAAHVEEGALADGFEDPVLCDVDFDSDGVNDIIVGQLLNEAYVYDKKMPEKVTEAFKKLNVHLHFVKRGV